MIPLGAHLVTPRRGFVHHGIHVGNGRVVHYAGLSRGLARGPVREVSLAEFERGHGWRIEAVAGRYDGASIADRARSRLGEDRYSVVSNNCEHFAHWCRDGEARSLQIDRWLRPLGRCAETFERAAQWAAGRFATPSQAGLAARSG